MKTQAPEQAGLIAHAGFRTHCLHPDTPSRMPQSARPDQAKATCPNGAHSRYWTEGLNNNQRPAIRICLTTETCAPSPARAQRTSSACYGRQLTVRPQDQDLVLERVRAEQEPKEWKAVYAMRSGVEESIYQAITVTGARRTRYAGLRKTTLTATAISLIRTTGRPDILAFR